MRLTSDGRSHASPARRTGGSYTSSPEQAPCYSGHEDKEAWELGSMGAWKHGQARPSPCVGDPRSAIPSFSSRQTKPSFCICLAWRISPGPSQGPQPRLWWFVRTCMVNINIENPCGPARSSCRPRPQAQRANANSLSICRLFVGGDIQGLGLRCLPVGYLEVCGRDLSLADESHAKTSSSHGLELQGTLCGICVQRRRRQPLKVDLRFFGSKAGQQFTWISLAILSDEQLGTKQTTGWN